MNALYTITLTEGPRGYELAHYNVTRDQAAELQRDWEKQYLAKEPEYWIHKITLERTTLPQ